MESIEEKSGIVTAGAPEARVRVLLPGVGERDLFELAELLGQLIEEDSVEENSAARARIGAGRQRTPPRPDAISF